MDIQTMTLLPGGILGSKKHPDGPVEGKEGQSCPGGMEAALGCNSGSPVFRLVLIYPSLTSRGLGCLLVVMTPNLILNTLESRIEAVSL